MSSEQAKRPATEMTTRELKLVLYRCAALMAAGPRRRWDPRDRVEVSQQDDETELRARAQWAEAQALHMLAAEDSGA
jgi:hypothetical protein